MQKPYYNLDFGATMCKFQIKVNNFEVFMLNIDGNVASEIPLNGGIFGSGEQQLEVRALPLDGEKMLHPQANFHYHVKAVDVNTANWNLIKSFDKKQVGPDPKSQSFLFSRSVFYSDVPYTVHNWADLKEIDENNLRDRVFDKYNDIVRAGRSGDYNKLFAAIELTEERNALTLYLSKGEVEARIDSIKADIEAGFKMMELDQNCMLEIAANGRLCRLVRLDGNSAMVLENKKTQEELIIDLWLCENTNKTLSIF